MKRVFWFLLGLCATAACVVHFTPAVTPQKIPPVSPRIRARALLLITPSFEAYLSRERNGVQQVFHYGEAGAKALSARSEEHTSELQSHSDLVCRLLLEKKKQATRE